MERQTRTKKYSDLRSQLENNNELDGKTEGLKAYEDKLKSVQEAANPTPTPEKVVVETAKEEVNPVMPEVQSEVQVTPDTQVSKDDVSELLAMINDDLQPKVETEVKPIEVIPTPAVPEETKVPEAAVSSDIQILNPAVPEETKVPEAVLTSEVHEESHDEVTVDHQKGEEYLAETLKEVNEYNKSQGLVTADDVPGRILDDLRGVTEEKPTVIETPTPEVHEETVTPEVPSEKTIEHEVDQDDLNNTVTMEIKKILEAMTEQAEASEKPEVHAEVVEPTPEENTETPDVQIELEAELPETKEAEAHETKTVTLEISLDQDNPSVEIKTDDGETATEESGDLLDLDGLLKAGTISKEAAELLRPYLRSDDDEKPIVQPTPEVKPVDEEDLSKINEEIEKTKVDILEAQSDNEATKPLLNDTIPFVVEKATEPTINSEAVEEESPSNKILNVILIVLIVILIAVLGVIAYWILLAQGIL